MKEANKEHSLSSYVVMCFVSPLNGLFASVRCPKDESSKPSGRMGKVWCDGGVAIYLWALSQWLAVCNVIVFRVSQMLQHY